MRSPSDCQSWVMALLYIRLLFFFRLSLDFGFLMHMVIEISRGVLPFLVLLIVVTLGFSFAVALLLRHTSYRQPDYDSSLVSLFTMINAGFRFVPPELAAVRSCWQVPPSDCMLPTVGRCPPLIACFPHAGKAAVPLLACFFSSPIRQVITLYMLFLFFVQVILLNLLIAMMGGSLARLRVDGELMAHFERAKLVLEQDEVVLQRRKNAARRDPESERLDPSTSPSRQGSRQGSRPGSGNNFSEITRRMHMRSRYTSGTCAHTQPRPTTRETSSGTYRTNVGARASSPSRFRPPSRSQHSNPSSRRMLSPREHSE